MAVFTEGFYDIDYLRIKGGRRSPINNAISLIKSNRITPTLKFLFSDSTHISIMQIPQTHRICEIFLKKVKKTSKM